MGKKLGKRRFNTYFRQTAKAFREARQTQIFSHIKRNLPYNVYKYSKSKVKKRVQNVQNAIGKQKMHWVRKIKTPQKQK